MEYTIAATFPATTCHDYIPQTPPVCISDTADAMNDTQTLRNYSGCIWDVKEDAEASEFASVWWWVKYISENGTDSLDWDTCASDWLGGKISVFAEWADLDTSGCCTCNYTPSPNTTSGTGCYYNTFISNPPICNDNCESYVYQRHYNAPIGLRWRARLEYVTSWKLYITTAAAMAEATNTRQCNAIFGGGYELEWGTPTYSPSASTIDNIGTSNTGWNGDSTSFHTDHSWIWEWSGDTYPCDAEISSTDVGVSLINSPTATSYSTGACSFNAYNNWYYLAEAFTPTWTISG